MKKFLSLVLALVMTMSLVTVSAGAKDFTDDDKITYDEAVAVISAIGVVDGYEDGSFKPTDTLSRGAAAKIICNLILGPTTAAALSADTAPFKDVPANSTFAGYITYCAQKGIISGYADGTFRPSNTLTGYAFMKMLLGALGYDAIIENYVGDNWSVQVAKQALGIGLKDGYVGDFDGTKAVTREEACLFALNTLEATMVEYDSKTSVSVSGVEVSIAGSESKEMDQGSYKSYTGDGDDDTLEFCEKYFDDLKKDESEDDFGRPADTWKIKSTEIGTWANTEDLVETWTAKVTQAALYKAVGKTVVDDLEDDEATLTYWVDGYKETIDPKDVDKFMDKNNTAKINDDAGDTGKGVLTEVYVDDDNNTTVVVIRTYVFQATEDYNSGKDSVKVTEAGDTDYLNITLDDYELDGDDFDIEDIAEDDYVLITATKARGDSKYEVQTVAKAEMVSGEVDSYSSGDDVTIDGTTYEYAQVADTDSPDTVCEEVNSTGGTTSLVLDQYGYVIAVDDTAVSGNYVFITETERNLGNAVSAYAYFADGTSGEISLKKVAGKTDAGSLEDAEGWYTYSQDSSGKYTLNKVGGSYKTVSKMEYTELGKILINGNANLQKLGTDSVKANEKTVFITVDEDGDVDIATGISNAPDVTVDALGTKNGKTVGYPIGYVYKSNGFASYVFVSVEDMKATVDSNSENDMFVFVTKSDSEKDNGSDNYWVYKAVVDGTEQLVELDYELGSADLMKLYTKVKIDNSTEFITDMDEVDEEEEDGTYAKIFFKDATVNYKDGVLTFDGTLTDKDGNAVKTDGDTFIVNSDSQLNLILNYSRGADAKKDKDVQAMMTDTGAGHEVHGNITGSSLKSTLSGYTVSGYFYVVTEDDYIINGKVDNTTLDYLFLCVNEATPTKASENDRTVTVTADAGAAVTIDGEVVANAPAGQFTITGLTPNGKYIVDGQYPRTADADGEYTITISNSARTLVSAGAIILPISVSAAKADGTSVNDSDYVPKGDEITLTFTTAGTYLVDGEEKTVKANDKMTVTVDGDVKVEEWRTEEEFLDLVDTSVKKLNSTFTNGTTDLSDLKNGNITIKFNGTPSGTGTMKAVEDLVNADCTVTVKNERGTNWKLTGDTTTDASAASAMLKEVLENAGTSTTLEVTVTNGLGEESSVTYQVTVEHTNA